MQHLHTLAFGEFDQRDFFHLWRFSSCPQNGRGVRQFRFCHELRGSNQRLPGSCPARTCTRLFRGQRSRACRMIPSSSIQVIIPALDEEATIAAVIRGLQGVGLNRIRVVDNGSRDLTVARAQGGARRGAGGG